MAIILPFTPPADPALNCTVGDSIPRSLYPQAASDIFDFNSGLSEFEHQYCVADSPKRSYIYYKGLIFYKFAYEFGFYNTFKTCYYKRVIDEYTKAVDACSAETAKSYIKQLIKFNHGVHFIENVLSSLHNINPLFGDNDMVFCSEYDMMEWFADQFADDIDCMGSLTDIQLPAPVSLNEQDRNLIDTYAPFFEQNNNEESFWRELLRDRLIPEYTLAENAFLTLPTFVFYCYKTSEREYPIPKTEQHSFLAYIYTQIQAFYKMMKATYEGYHRNDAGHLKEDLLLVEQGRMDLLYFNDDENDDLPF